MIIEPKVDTNIIEHMQWYDAERSVTCVRFRRWYYDDQSVGPWKDTLLKEGFIVLVSDEELLKRPTDYCYSAAFLDQAKTVLDLKTNWYGSRIFHVRELNCYPEMSLKEFLNPIY